MSILFKLCLHTLGPRPHFLGYVSLSIITLLIFATTPWSHAAMTAVVIRAMPKNQECIVRNTFVLT